MPSFKKEEICRSARVKEDLWFYKHEAEMIEAARARKLAEENKPDSTTVRAEK